ncbi:DCA15 factor, partial [Amia calva]|nr:DCA15 factor [Amia calva]
VLSLSQVSGQLSQRVFRKLPPRVCVSLKSIVSEEFLRAGHIFLGFTKCGRYVLSYTSDCGDDDFSFYTYRLYWWEFNLHSRLRQVREVRLFAGEEIYSDLFLTVCEWPSDRSKIVVFGFNTRSSSSLLMNLMMSDENNRDIYITIASMPPPQPCAQCSGTPGPAQTVSDQCLAHGYLLNSRYQVVYPFPTFQPAFQLKQDQVVLLNTSYSLVACAVSVCPGKGYYTVTTLFLHCRRASATLTPVLDRILDHLVINGHQTSMMGRRVSIAACNEPIYKCDVHIFVCALLLDVCDAGLPRPPRFCADRAQAGEREQRMQEDEEEEESERESKSKSKSRASSSSSGLEGRGVSGQAHQRNTAGPLASASSPSSPSASSPASSSSSPPPPSEPGSVNYTRLQYCLQPPGAPEQDTDYEDDKGLLPFTVTDLQGRNLRLLKGPQSSQGQCVCVEQLTLDFEYVINEVIRRDAAWSDQFCSFSDYDIVILEVCPELHTVVINIGLLLLAFPSPEEEHCRPHSYHSSLQVCWDLSSGACHTVGVGDLIEVKGQTSGSVWSSYRKSCVNTVMKWLVPESSSRYINRMTNEALHKGTAH